MGRGHKSTETQHNYTHTTLYTHITYTHILQALYTLYYTHTIHILYTLYYTHIIYTHILQALYTLYHITHTQYTYYTHYTIHTLYIHTYYRHYTHYTTLHTHNTHIYTFIRWKTLASSCTLADNRQYSLLPGLATSLSANSCWNMSTAHLVQTGQYRHYCIQLCYTHYTLYTWTMVDVIIIWTQMETISDTGHNNRSINNSYKWLLKWSIKNSY